MLYYTTIEERFEEFKVHFHLEDSAKITFVFAEFGRNSEISVFFHNCTEIQRQRAKFFVSFFSFALFDNIGEKFNENYVVSVLEASSEKRHIFIEVKK